MKFKLTRHLLAPVLAAALPCVAFGQAGSSSSPSTKAQQDRARTAPSHSAIDSSRDAKDAMQLVTKAELDRQMTAKTLIGTDVHGADGKKIGSVVDVVLASSLNMGTKPAHAAAKDTYGQSAARTDKPAPGQAARVGTSTAGPSPTTATTAQTSGAKATTEARRTDVPFGDQYSSGMGRDQMQQPAVVISTGGVFGIGSDLIRVPFSKVNYDSANKEVRLNISETEWQSLRDGIARSGVTSAR